MKNLVITFAIFGFVRCTPSANEKVGATNTIEHNTSTANEKSVEAENKLPGNTGEGSSLSGTSSSLAGNVSEFNIQINLSSDVMFDFDKAILKPTANAELQKVAEVIKAKGKGLITITGYTDARGSDAHNIPLSIKRATAVKEWFEANGVNGNYHVEGKGAANPVAPNTQQDGSDNPDGRQKNRRVEIIVNKTKALGE